MPDVEDLAQRDVHAAAAPASTSSTSRTSRTRTNASRKPAGRRMSVCGLCGAARGKDDPLGLRVRVDGKRTIACKACWKKRQQEKDHSKGQRARRNREDLASE
jgi:hypothetical protein